MERTNAKIINVFQDIKTAKTAVFSEVNFEMKAASGEVGDDVMSELCQRVLYRKGYLVMIEKQAWWDQSFKKREIS